MAGFRPVNIPGQTECARSTRNLRGSVEFLATPARLPKRCRIFSTAFIPGRLSHGHSQPGPWPRRPSPPGRLASLVPGASFPGLEAPATRLPRPVHPPDLAVDLVRLGERHQVQARRPSRRRRALGGRRRGRLRRFPGPSRSPPRPSGRGPRRTSSKSFQRSPRGVRRRLLSEASPCSGWVGSEVSKTEPVRAWSRSPSESACGARGEVPTQALDVGEEVEHRRQFARVGRQRLVQVPQGETQLLGVPRFGRPVLDVHPGGEGQPQPVRTRGDPTGSSSSAGPPGRSARGSSHTATSRLQPLLAGRRGAPPSRTSPGPPPARGGGGSARCCR